MSGRSLTEKGRRKRILRRAKPGYHHKGTEVDGGKTKKSRVWYEGPPQLPSANGTVSTIFQTNGKD